MILVGICDRSTFNTFSIAFYIATRNQIKKRTPLSTGIFKLFWLKRQAGRALCLADNRFVYYQRIVKEGSQGKFFCRYFCSYLSFNLV